MAAGVKFDGVTGASFSSEACASMQPSAAPGAGKLKNSATNGSHNQTVRT